MGPGKGRLEQQVLVGNITDRLDIRKDSRPALSGLNKGLLEGAHGPPVWNQDQKFRSLGWIPPNLMVDLAGQNIGEGYTGGDGVDIRPARVKELHGTAFPVPYLKRLSF